MFLSGFRRNCECAWQPSAVKRASRRNNRILGLILQTSRMGAHQESLAGILHLHEKVFGSISLQKTELLGDQLLQQGDAVKARS